MLLTCLNGRSGSSQASSRAPLYRGREARAERGPRVAGTLVRGGFLSVEPCRPAAMEARRGAVPDLARVPLRLLLLRPALPLVCGAHRAHRPGTVDDCGTAWRPGRNQRDRPTLV